MLVKLDSVLFSGLNVEKVIVEVNVSSRGLPAFDIVGLGGRSVEESKHRIKAAVQNSGLNFPDKKITVNLAPADIAKEGSFYDLPICIALLSAHLGFPIPANSIFFGELSLDGAVRHSKGAFLLALYAKENGYTNIFVSKEDAAEVRGAVGSFGHNYPVGCISDLVKHLLGRTHIDEYVPEDVSVGDQLDVTASGSGVGNFESMVGQEQIKRALTISAAGGHNLIMMGPPGSGKSMGALALSELLPPLSDDEAVEVTKIYSLIGNVPKGCSLIRDRPFRQPHHTSSYAGMIGGGNNSRPGEITLAHNGILFLDEFSEFSRNVLEALRQPLETGRISISRSKGTVAYPANFTLVAAGNPCPCGYLGDPFHECRCPASRIEQYRRKMSGPIMDRIDLHVSVRPAEKQKLMKVFEPDTLSVTNRTYDDKNSIKNMIKNAREIQRIRFTKEHIFTNSRMSNELIGKYSCLGSSALALLNRAMSGMNFSTRSYFKLIKIARTIADLEEKEEIGLDHMAEAIQYRVDT